MKLMTALAATASAALLSTAAFGQVTPGAADITPDVTFEQKPEPRLIVDSDATVAVVDKVNTFPKPVVDVDAETQVTMNGTTMTPGIEGSIMHTVSLADGTRAGDIDSLIRDADGELESVVVLVRGGVDEPLVPVELSLSGAQVVNGELILALSEAEFMQMVEATADAG